MQNHKIEKFTKKDKNWKSAEIQKFKKNAECENPIKHENYQKSEKLERSELAKHSKHENCAIPKNQQK